MLTAVLPLLLVHGSPLQHFVDEPLATVTVELGALDQDSFNRLRFTELYKSLLVRITQEELAVVDSSQKTDLVMAFSIGRAGAVEIRVDWDGGSKRKLVPVGGRSLRELHLAIMHQCVELLREARALLPPPSPSPAVDSEPPGKWQLRLSASGSAWWNPGQGGLLGDLGGNLSGESGLGIEATVSLAVPLGVPRRLSIVEWGARLGGSFRLPLGDRLVWAAVLAVGLWSHHYRYEDPAGVEDRGSRLEPAGFLQTSLRFAFLGPLEVSVSGGLLITPRERVHYTLKRRLFRTTPVRGWLGVALSYPFVL